MSAGAWRGHVSIYDQTIFYIIYWLEADHEVTWNQFYTPTQLES